MNQPIPFGPWHWLNGCLLQGSGQRHVVLMASRMRSGHELHLATRDAETGTLRPITDSEPLGRALALLPELVAFLKRVAYDPIGASDATETTILDTLFAEAKALHKKISP